MADDERDRGDFADRVRDVLAAVVAEFERAGDRPQSRRVIGECKRLLREARGMTCR